MREADERLEAAFEALAPAEAQVRRIEARLEEAMSAPQQSLLSEWVDVLRIRPLTHGALAVFSSAAFLATTPLGAALLALLRAAASGEP